MLGFLAAIVHEGTNGESVFTQLVGGGGGQAAAIIALVTVASFAPMLRVRVGVCVPGALFVFCLRCWCCVRDGVCVRVCVCVRARACAFDLQSSSPPPPWAPPPPPRTHRRRRPRRLARSRRSCLGRSRRLVSLCVFVCAFARACLRAPRRLSPHPLSTLPHPPARTKSKKAELANGRAAMCGLSLILFFEGAGNQAFFM